MLSDVNPAVTAAQTPAPASNVTVAAGEEAPVEAQPDGSVALKDNEAKPVPFQPEP